MNKILIVSCYVGLFCAFILHVFALSGSVPHNDFPLEILVPVLFINCAIAIFRWLKKHPEGLELTKLKLPRRQLVFFSILIIYGFLFSVLSGRGEATHNFGEILDAQNALFFYSLMILFFAIALLLHNALLVEGDVDN